MITQLLHGQPYNLPCYLALTFVFCPHEPISRTPSEPCHDVRHLAMMGLAPNYGREIHKVLACGSTLYFSTTWLPPATVSWWLLVPLYKNKGMASDPSSYRGILLQNTAAKIFAKSWRSRLVAHFSSSMAPMQCGCVKRRGVDSAHLAVRLHMHTAHVQQQASAILFIDIKAAYYSVVKESGRVQRCCCLV